MAEKLIVKNFAGIKELEIEVKSINILIGPQASGKSVCPKLLFYFKSFVWDILETVENDQDKRYLDSKFSHKFKDYFPVTSWGNDEFHIKYEFIKNGFRSLYIEIKRKDPPKNQLVLNYDDFYKKQLSKLRKAKKANEVKEQPPMGRIYYNLRKFLVDDLNNSLLQEAAFSQLFIPAGRSFFANLQSNIFSILSRNNVLDPFLIAFGSRYETLKRTTYHLQENPVGKEIEDEINKLIEKALCGKYIHEKGEDFLETVDGRRINLAIASSGQQETLPLAIMLAKLPFVIIFDFTGQTVYIEEPEAHLFPSAQRNIIELIATVFNSRKEQLQFFITTHSPYILTSINNLLQAGSLYEQSISLDELEKIVPRYKALMLSDLSAYALENGRCTSIICPDTGLIDANVIDRISDDLAIEFDKLLNLVE